MNTYRADVTFNHCFAFWRNLWWRMPPCGEIRTTMGFSWIPRYKYDRLLYHQIQSIHIKGNNRTGWDTFTVWHNLEFIWSLHNLSIAR